jgi:hypothetical protein
MSDEPFPPQSQEIAPEPTDGLGDVDVSHNSSITPGYETYSLFLLTNLEWHSELDNEGLRRVYETYRLFGDLIGPKHLAVWFWQQLPDKYDGKTRTHVTKENIDVRRSADFAGAYGLRVSEGPHVVLLRMHPNDARRSKDATISSVQLSRLPPRSVDALLNALAGAITEGELLEQIASKEQWLRFTGRAKGLAHAVSGFLNRIEFTVKSPFGEFKLAAANG